MKIKDLLTDESKWTKGAYAKDEHGQIVEVNEPREVCWCLSGAIYKCYGGSDERNIRHKVLAKIRTEFICAWNDAPERTFAEVKALVEELDI